MSALAASVLYDLLSDQAHIAPCDGRWNKKHQTQKHEIAECDMKGGKE